MSTKNPYHRMHRKEVFWQHHIDCWSQTTQTQAHYCRKNDLSQSDFSKWKKKLKPHAKRNLRKRPLHLEKKRLSKIVMASLSAHGCSFCGHSERSSGVNKLFYGLDEYVAICDYCLWIKSGQLHWEIPYYKNIRIEKCSACFEDMKGVVIGNVYYRLCADCLISAWRDHFSLHPESHPCRNTCVACGTKDPKDHMVLGEHILCQICLTRALKKFMEVSFDYENCSFCKERRSEEKPMYGSNVRWICEPCAETAISTLKALDQSNTLEVKICSICAIEKNKDLTFVEGENGNICEPCVRESYELLSKN